MSADKVIGTKFASYFGKYEHKYAYSDQCGTWRRHMLVPQRAASDQA